MCWKVRELCQEHHVEGRQCYDAELAVSELLGNALRHGRPPIELEVSWLDGGVLVSVVDAQPLRQPEQLAPAPTAESGRGLQLIDAVARSWGCEPRRDGKRVWALV